MTPSAPPVPIAASAAASSPRLTGRAAPRSPAIRTIRPIAAGSAPRARRWARRCRSKTGCSIPRSTAGACRGTRALDAVAEGIGEIIARHGPEAVAFYVSGQLLTEDYYAANKLSKGFLGTANIDTNSRLCMASSVAGHKRAFGSDTVPGLYEDFELADLVVLVGSNLAWCHPVLFQRLEAAKRARPDMKIVVIDPRRTETCDIADLHLALRPGSDVGPVQRPAGRAGAPRRRRHGLRRAAHDRPRRRAGRGAAPAISRDCDLPAGDVATFFDWFAQGREDGHALFAGRQPVERRRRQGERPDQLPSADRPHRPAGHGTVLDHRPAQRHGRPRSGRAFQHARRAHGVRAGRHRSRRPLLARRAHGDAARPEGGRSVRRGRARRDQGGMDHGDQSGRQPAQRRRRARGAEGLRAVDRLRGGARQRHRRCLPHPPAGARLGGEGRHGHQLRARHLAPAAVPAAARRGAAGLVDHAPRSRGAWASATPSPGRRRRHLPRACRPFGLRERRHARLRHRRVCRLDDRGYETLAPFVWPAGWRTSGGASSPTAASSMPTGARASSRPCRARRCTHRPSSGRCGSTPAACATSGTP